MKFHITPGTKIMDILSNYPEVEDFLIELVPTFEKLKNPVLRNTIGKLATIEQAAKVGNISMPFLINSLNQKLGLISENTINAHDIEANHWNQNDFTIATVLDADKMLADGEKPVAKVLAELAKLEEGSILQLNATFLPAPLIDLIKDKGYDATEVKNLDYSMSIFFKKK